MDDTYDYNDEGFGYDEDYGHNEEGGALARPTDPETSHDAADSLSAADLSRLQGIIIDILREHRKGLITHEIARECLRRGLPIGWGTVTPRMKPLVEKGLVYDTGRRRAWVGCEGNPASTRMSIVWQLESLREEDDRLNPVEPAVTNPAGLESVGTQPEPIVMPVEM